MEIAALVTRFGIKLREKSRLIQLFKTVFVLFAVDRTRVLKRNAYVVSADIRAIITISYSMISK